VVLVGEPHYPSHGPTFSRVRARGAHSHFEALRDRNGGASSTLFWIPRISVPTNTTTHLREPRKGRYPAPSRALSEGANSLVGDGVGPRSIFRPSLLRQRPRSERGPSAPPQCITSFVLRRFAARCWARHKLAVSTRYRTFAGVFQSRAATGRDSTWPIIRAAAKKGRPNLCASRNLRATNSRRRTRL